MAALMNFLNEVTKHALRRIEICNDTIFEWTDRNNVSWCATNHAFSLEANRKDAASVLINSYDAGLVQDDASTAYIHERVCSTEVNGHIATHKGTR